MARLLLGKEVTAALNERLKARAAALREKGIAPKLAIVRCGENPSDLSYERSAVARAGQVGVEVEVFALPGDAPREALLDCIRGLNADPSVHGVLLFRPLPVHLRGCQDAICNALDPAKDVDGMTDLSMSGVFQGRTDLGFPPCTPRACMEVLDHYGIELKGRKAVVIGRSPVVGKPLSMMLLGRHATVTICHTRTADVAAEARQADILVSAAGALHSLTASHVRPGQVVIDVSVNWDPEKPNARGGRGAIAGDAEFDAVEPVVDAITPVPGGVGGVTASVLIAHTVEAAERAARRP